ARKTLTAETTVAHAETSVSILASHFTYVPGQQPSLDSVADRAMTPLRQTVGDSNFEEKKFKTQLAGIPANDEYQVTMMCRADQPHADDVWQKLRASIKKTPPR